MASSKKKATSKEAAAERRMTLADLWDNTDAAEASSLPSVGEHEMRLNKLELNEDKKKGTAVIAEFEIIEGEEEGKKIRQMYKLRDQDGSKGPGLAYLNRDLALLGYEDIPGSKLKKTLKEISEEQPMLVVNVKDNGQYRNAYIQGLLEDAGGGGDEDEDDEDGEDAEIEEGSKVAWEEGDEEFSGEVIKINKKKGTAKVTDEDGEEHTVDLEDLTLAADEDDEDEKPKKGAKAKSKGKKSKDEDEDDEDGEDDDDEDEVELTVPEVGDEVTFTDPEDEDETLEGEVVKVNEKKETFDAKVGKKTIKGIEFSAIITDDGDSEGEDEEDEEFEAEVGARCKWTDDDGDEFVGEIKKLNAKKGTAKVEDDDGDEHTVPIGDLEAED